MEQQVLEATYQAIGRARQALWQDLRPDGAWQNEDYSGPGYTGMLLAVESYLGVLSERDAREATRWLRGQQRDDGSFLPYPYASRGLLSTSCCVYAGLGAAGVPPDDPAMQRLRGFIDAAGGLGAADPFTKLFLVMGGQLAADHLPAAPPPLSLIPGATRLLAVIFTAEIILALSEVAALTRGLRARAQAPRWYLRPAAALVNQKTIEYLAERQGPDGTWAGVFPSTALGAACLHSLGVPRSDPSVQRALGALSRWKVYGADGMYVVPFTSEVWDTACVARVLVESGVADDHPGILRAMGYLLGQQTETEAPLDFQNPRPGAPRTGGWAFGDSDPLCPDNDTTAAVLAALHTAGRMAADPGNRAAAERGMAWLLGMQNPDGGWAGFSYGHRSKKPGPAPVHDFLAGAGVMDILRFVTNPPVGFDDPSSEELTGRVLSTLALFGYTTSHPVVERAIAFIKAQRDGSGVWWGRWMVNYLAATSCILSGLAAVGEDMRAPYVRQAVAWVKGRQNPDGGWGETVESYLRADLAGVGPSTPGLTGLVLSALIDGGDGAAPEVERGVRYLLGQQNAAGRWEDRCCLKVVQPPNVYYGDRLFPIYAPVRAMTQFLKLQAS